MVSGLMHSAFEDLNKCMAIVRIFAEENARDKGKDFFGSRIDCFEEPAFEIIRLFPGSVKRLGAPECSDIIQQVSFLFSNIFDDTAQGK